MADPIIKPISSFRSKLIRVSSEDKDVGSSTSNSRFNIILNNDSSIIDNIIGIVVKSVSFPNIFPNVPDYANRIIIEDSTTPGTYYDIDIPINQYTITDLKTQLKTSIDAIVPGTVTITETADDKLIFTFSNTSKFYLVDPLNTNNTATMKNIIGLGVETAVFTSVITMDNRYNLMGETELYVHSTTLAQSNLIEPSGTFSVVESVGINVPFGSNQIFETADTEVNDIRYEPFESERSIRNISIVLRNRMGHVLTLPDNFNFNIIFKVYY